MVQEWKPVNPPAPPPPPEPPAAGGPHRWRQVFRGLPVHTPEGLGPFNIPCELADDIATHVEKSGFVHVDEIRALIAQAGVIDTVWLEARMPRQTRRQEPPEHGPDIWMNPPRWVDDNEETA